jgi:endonuclease/exonuclease/phosphatase (EEP) superfamily protein YafD
MFRFRHWLGLFFSTASILIGVGIMLCYITRDDRVSVITLLPFWVWGIIGTGLSTIAWQWHRKRWQLLIPVIWILLTLFYSDDVSRFIRPHLFSKRPASGLHLRIISLNCAGQAAAAAEPGSWKPDIVLLQESPSSNDVSRLAREWFGNEADFLVGWDCSIIARGRLTRLSGLKTTRFTQARLTLPQGKDMEVVSLRLIPPETRLDLWSPACWRAHLHDRLERKWEMQQLVDELQGFKADIPHIAGGDFNSPAGDAVSRLLKPRLKDTFREGGIGWGNTGINEFPISRPDQIWVSGDYQTIAAWAVKTRNSDHRMVVCDLVLHP